MPAAGNLRRGVDNSDNTLIQAGTEQNVTRGQTFTTTVPYASTHATAEWIEETPLLIGTNAGAARGGARPAIGHGLIR